MKFTQTFLFILFALLLCLNAYIYYSTEHKFEEVKNLIETYQNNSINKIDSIEKRINNIKYPPKRLIFENHFPVSKSLEKRLQEFDDRINELERFNKFERFDE